MTVAEALAAFVAAATILTITPGTDTALVLRLSATTGARPAAFAAVGIVMGCLFWGALAAVGLGALLATSPLAFAILQWIGGAYLCWLGLTLILHPRRALAQDEHEVDGKRDWDALRQGLFTNILNPKVGIFYVSFLPLFVPPGVSAGPFLLLLAVIHGALGLGWFAVIISASKSLRRLLAAPRAITALDRIAGAVFIGFGVKLALSRA
jgi:threonine/homoserine/homoserine lactone efflux protein